MENGETHPNASSPIPSCPPPPDPNITESTTASADAYHQRSDLPLHLESEQWDIESISGLGALRMLMDALEKLAESTGDVPPTPPISRPSTPTRSKAVLNRQPSHSKPLKPSPSDPPTLHIGSPEAHASEPLTIQVGVYPEDITMQHAAIARRFFSRTAPPFSLTAYLLRLHQYCPHTPAVYLAAGVYIHQLCVVDRIVPATARTIHRLSLAAIRVAAKVLEDNKWAQERYAKVGGVSNAQMMSLEVTMLFLLDFDLYVDPGILARRSFALQQVARHGYGVRGRLGDGFRLRPPPVRKATMDRIALATG